MERAGGWLFFRIFNALSDWPISANLVTVRLMTRRYVAALIEHRERETMIAGLWAITGFNQVALPIRKHAHSASTYRLTHKIAILVNSITSFSDKPLVLIFYLGMIICRWRRSPPPTSWFAGCSSVSCSPAGRHSSSRCGCSGD